MYVIIMYSLIATVFERNYSLYKMDLENGIMQKFNHIICCFEEDLK